MKYAICRPTPISLKAITFVIIALASVSPSFAATINFDAFRAQSSQQNLATHTQFLNAVHTAGNGGTLILGSNTYTSNSTFTIDRDVTVIGQSEALTTLAVTASDTRTLRIDSSGVTVRNLKIVNQSSFGITTFGKFNVSIESVTIDGAKYGIDTYFGGRTEGLRVMHCEFRNIKNYGIWFISRDGFGANEKAKPWHGRFILDWNDFFTTDAANRQPRAGINVDWGNERAADEDWGVDHSSGGSLRSTIRKNVIRPTGEWNIALARAKHILIQGNECHGGTIDGYTQALHIEDRSDNITANWNKFWNEKNGRGAHAVVIEASNVNDAQTSSRVKINNNTIHSRSTVAAVQATDTKDLEIKNNHFEDPRAIKDILLWASDSSHANVNPTISGNTAASGSVVIQQ